MSRSRSAARGCVARRRRTRHRASGVSHGASRRSARNRRPQARAGDSRRPRRGASSRLRSTASVGMSHCWPTFTPGRLPVSMRRRTSFEPTPRRAAASFTVRWPVTGLGICGNMMIAHDFSRHAMSRPGRSADWDGLRVPPGVRPRRDARTSRPAAVWRWHDSTQRGRTSTSYLARGVGLLAGALRRRDGSRGPVVTVTWTKVCWTAGRRA